MSTASEEYKKSLREEAAKERDTQIVTNMLKEHFPIARIAKYTQLSPDKILQIAKANNIPMP